MVKASVILARDRVYLWEFESPDNTAAETTYIIAAYRKEKRDDWTVAEAIRVEESDDWVYRTLLLEDSAGEDVWAAVETALELLEYSEVMPAEYTTTQEMQEKRNLPPGDMTWNEWRLMTKIKRNPLSLVAGAALLTGVMIAYDKAIRKAW